jgi:hypothetical protein
LTTSAAGAADVTANSAPAAAQSRANQFFMSRSSPSLALSSRAPRRVDLFDMPGAHCRPA